MKHNKLGHIPLLAISFMGIILAAILSGTINVQLAKIADLSLANNQALLLQSTKTIVWLAFSLLFVAFVNTLLKKNYLKKSMTQLKSHYTKKLLNRSPLFFSRIDSAKITSNLTNNMDRLEKQHYEVLLELLIMVAQFMVASIILIHLYVWFLPLIVGLLILFVVISRKSSEPIQEKEEEKSESLITYTRFVDESLNGFEVIKQHGLMADREAHFKNLTKKLKEDQIKVDRQFAYAEATNDTIQVFLMLVVIIALLALFTRFNVGIGSLMLMILAFSDVLVPLQRFSPLLMSLHSIAPVFAELEESLFEEKELSTQTIDEFKEITFENVTLAYDEPILKQVSFQLKENQKTLIVGPSGEGKSTLLKAILKTMPCEEGFIKMNDICIDSIHAERYLSQFAHVAQHGFIFSDTLQNNITLLDDKPHNIDLTNSQLHHLDLNMTLLNDGSNLSGGERARLLFERAKYFNKPILVCDEIFASLDFDIAKELERQILKESKTLINVSHIVFKDHLDDYDQFLIVKHKKVLVSKDKNDVLKLLLDENIVFN